MKIEEWNPLVNKKLSLGGDWGLKGGFVKTLKFESGKERTYHVNSYIPRVYSSVGLTLDNIAPTASGKTEFEEFDSWYNEKLNYGVLSFYLPRIGYRKNFDIRVGETGIYSFVPESLKYDKIKGLVYATFGLEEEGALPAIPLEFLATEKDEILFTHNNTAIVT